MVQRIASNKSTHYRLAVQRELVHVATRLVCRLLVAEADERLPAHLDVAVGSNGRQGEVRLEQRLERLLHDCGEVSIALERLGVKADER